MSPFRPLSYFDSEERHTDRHGHSRASMATDARRDDQSAWTAPSDYRSSHSSTTTKGSSRLKRPTWLRNTFLSESSLSKKSEKETSVERDNRREKSPVGTSSTRKMFNLNNMSTPAIVASRSKPRRPPILHNLSYFSQSDSETDEEAEQESLGFPRPRYSRHGNKVLDLKKAMLSNMSLADLLPRSKGNNANHTLPINSPIPVSGYNATTSQGSSKHDGELSTGGKLGSPIRLQPRRQDSLQSPTPTNEAHVPSPLTLSELRQLRSTADTTFHDARRFGNPLNAQTPLSGVSRPVTPLPARSPMRPETPLQRRKPVPAYLDTALRDQTESTPSCAILTDGQNIPPGRFASHVYANPSASLSMGALKLYDGSPISPEARVPFKSSYSAKDSISSSSFFSVSSTVSTERHCRSSLESVEQYGEVRRNDLRVEDPGSLSDVLSPWNRASPNFVLSVDAPLPCRRTSAAETLGRQLMAACASTPVLVKHSQTRITTPSAGTTKIHGPDHAARIKLSWGKFRRNF